MDHYESTLSSISLIFQQAQVHYKGKLRYIGVFDSKTKAGLAYEIAGQVLEIANKSNGPFNAKEVVRNVELAQKAAAECVAALTKKNDG